MVGQKKIPLGNKYLSKGATHLTLDALINKNLFCFISYFMNKSNTSICYELIRGVVIPRAPIPEYEELFIIYQVEDNKVYILKDYNLNVIH
jgi:hypothetical protein